MSDIHFGQEDKKGDRIVHMDVRRELERDCKRLKDKIGAADGLIITGDIAYSGKWPEYEEAMVWLDSLCETVGCEADSVLVVPGNHDVDLEKLRGSSRFTHNALRSCNGEKIDELLNEVHQSPEEAHPFVPKSAAYRRMASAYRCDYKITTPYWCKDFDLSSGCRLRFIGLNTVQVSDLGDKQGELLLGSAQYVLPREDNVENVVLMHHPLEWLKDKSSAKTYFNSRAKVIICGHEHQAAITVSTHAQKFEQLVIDSGATNPPKTEAGYGYTYNWIEFHLSTTKELGSTLVVHIFPRIWNTSDTRFDADSRRVKLTHFNNEAAEIHIRCPEMQVPAKPVVLRGEPVTQIGEQTSISPLSTSEVSSKSSNTAARYNKGKGVLVAAGEDRRFKLLQYFFWRYTEGSHRLAFLVDLSLIQSGKGYDLLPQDLEMKLLQRAKEQGKLKLLWDKVMTKVPSEKRQNNPFKAGE